MWGKGPRGNNTTCTALPWLLVTSPTTHKQIGPFWCCFPGGLFCVGSRTPQVSPTKVSGSSSCHLNPHRCFQSEVLRLYFSVLEPCVAWSVLLPSCSSWLSACKCATLPLCQPLPCPVHWPQPHLPRSSSCCVATSPLHPSCLLPPFLLVRMNASSLIPSLLDFHTV